MGEIRTLPWNGLTVASTFSGAGGSCLGYRMAGFKVLWANEFSKNPAVFYRRNFPQTILDARDVRHVTATDVLAAIGMKKGELDVLDGSPPCDSFSMVGKREKGWGKKKTYYDGKVQRTDDLFFEYARLLEGLQPRAFVAENVKGMVTGKAKGYFKLVLRRLKACGYRVRVRVLEGRWLGVPQIRQRVIFVGIREDLNLDPVHPSPFQHLYSFADACPWVFGARHETGTESFSQGKLSIHCPSPSLVSAQRSMFFITQERKLTNRELRDLHGQHSPGKVTWVKRGGKRFKGRFLTTAEAKRLCSFPDDYDMRGPVTTAWQALGMSVPPLMIREVSSALRDQLLGASRGT